MKNYQQLEEEYYEDTFLEEEFQPKKRNIKLRIFIDLLAIIGLSALLFVANIDRFNSIVHPIHKQTITITLPPKEEVVSIDFDSLYLFNQLPAYDPALSIIVENKIERLVLDKPRLTELDYASLASKAIKKNYYVYAASNGKYKAYDLYNIEGYHLVLNEALGTYALTFEAPTILNHHDWLNDELGSHYPKLDGKFVLLNDLSYLHIYLYENVTELDFLNYRKQLINAGFSQIERDENNVFVAFNQEGYGISFSLDDHYMYVRISNHKNEIG